MKKNSLIKLKKLDNDLKEKNIGMSLKGFTILFLFFKFLNLFYQKKKN